MEPADFSNRRTYPGTEGGPFEILLRITQPLTELRWHWLLIVLFLIQIIVWWLKPGRLILPFYLVDWGILLVLPKAGRSFGPSQPSTLLLALLRLPFAFLPGVWWCVSQIAGTVLVIDGFWIEPHRLTVTKEKLQVPTWTTDHKIRMVHFGDLHLERWGTREDRLLGLIKSMHPDIVLFSGDFLSFSYVYDTATWRDVRRFFSQITAPLGVYVVSGSPPVDPHPVLEEMLTGVFVRWLRDEKVRIQTSDLIFDLIGLSCSHQPSVDGKRLKAIEIDGEIFTLLLYHSPDLAPVAASLKIDLQLSGHTHGGQVRLPWLGALYTSSLYGKRFEMGRYQLGQMTLYVTRGIGLEGKTAPRARFLCPPEVTLWEISGTG